MNVLRNQWSVSGQTVAVMQLGGSDEMGRVERGVLSSRHGHQSCSLYAPTPLSCRRCVGVLEASGVVEVVVWRRLDRWRSGSGLHELHRFVLFVTCQQWSLEHRTTASCSISINGCYVERAGHKKQLLCISLSMAVCQQEAQLSQRDRATLRVNSTQLYLTHKT